jgi:hypothetical protein
MSKRTEDTEGRWGPAQWMGEGPDFCPVEDYAAGLDAAASFAEMLETEGNGADDAAAN